MKVQKLNFKNSREGYSIYIGTNILNILPKKIKVTCPKTKKIVIIIDKKVPKKFYFALKKKLRRYNLVFIQFGADEKAKSLKSVNNILNKMLSYNLNRTDLVISVGGGVTGDVAGFVSSVYKRGVNFINIPTTLLAQVDSAIGGKTGVNTKYGKNLIGTFYQPKLVVIDTFFLKSLPKREIICGYAEILKHSIIKDQLFFRWLKINTKNILKRKNKELAYAIKKSCQIKMYFVNKDVNERGLRMTLNFGHTFAHALEVKNNFSKKLTHGEAVLSGIILASRLSVVKKICNVKIFKEIEKIYIRNNLSYTFKRFSNPRSINGLIPYLRNDKKNNDEKINFILLKNLGRTTKPNSCKISVSDFKKLVVPISQF